MDNDGSSENASASVDEAEEVWEAASAKLRVAAAVIMFVFGILGLLINGAVCMELRQNLRDGGGFYKMCTSKTISNSIICFTFLVWCSPCSFFDVYYLPYEFNMFFGLFAAWTGYMMGPLAQFCMATNRFAALFIPHFFVRKRKVNISTIALASCWTFATCISWFGARRNCAYIYYQEQLVWASEDEICSAQVDTYYYYFIIGLSVASNALNMSIVVKLVVDASKSLVNRAVSQKRRKQRLLMFFQSVTQDWLHVFDVINTWYTYQLNDAVWFQFLTLSFSFLAIHVIDGIVMAAYNRNVRLRLLALICRREIASSTMVVTSSPASTNFVRLSIPRNK